ncbi:MULTISPECIES: hypothetical protein [unclassified Bacillus (in: firmicutes)]|uniref:hypothetical protein n=1 Tax=unclassified Bacillus (in: firmicutes) TaxID=185979 RepID=UPI001BE744F5|nr:MULTISPECIES: hypothetical protein [unclassified Bacillus (in: firmicutes)]MBT2616370.1 hypothetical protein [Bacillus sp. ISL-78]MBT2630017.1 hypothetical protein [Bacillus sp. ISL-101]
MTGFLKNLTFIFILFVFVFLSTDTGHASDELSSSGMLNVSPVKISITNDQTGETTFLDPIYTKNIMKINLIKSNNNSIDVGYNFFVPLENENSSGITPFTVTGGLKTSGGITARLNVNYDVSSNKEKIKLNKVYGSWTPSSNMYSLSTRTVNAHSGTIQGKSLPQKKPSSNSFTYTTGWGYNYFATGQASPRAWSSAKAHISGMTATHTIKLEFTYP